MSNNEMSWRASESRIWTPKRTQWMGLAGLLGCGIGGILVIGVSASGINSFEPGTLSGIIGSGIHALVYALMLGLLFAGYSRFSIGSSRVNRATSFLLAASFIGLFVSMMALSVGIENSAVAVLAGISFLGAHVLGTVFGIVLWRAEEVSRLAAGLFLAVVPVIGVVIVLAAAGVTVHPAMFEAPLALGFATLGYQLWSDESISRDMEPVA